MVLLAGLALLLLFGALSKGQRSQMFRASSKRCGDCGRKWDDGWMLEFHHIVAVFEGGTDEDSNIVLLCRECHHKRHVELSELRRKQGNKSGANGHATAARQVASRIKTKGMKRYGY